MYTLKDYHEAERALQKAEEREARKVRQQAKTRENAENALQKLDAALFPVQEARMAATSTLHDLQARLLGPWADTDHGSANMLLSGQHDKCWDNRVWLRLANYRGLQWEVRIREVHSYANKDFILGRPSGERKVDMAACKRRAEDLVIEMGYILGGD